MGNEKLAGGVRLKASVLEWFIQARRPSAAKQGEHRNAQPVK
jgi:hypothetical protein